MNAILGHLDRIDNTVQYSWFLEIARSFLDFKGDRISATDADALWSAGEKQFSQADWEKQVLAKSNVDVLTIKPGFVDTPMTAAIANKGALWATPERVAAGIVRAIDRRRSVVYLPGFWRGIMLVIRTIPEPLFKKLKL